MLRNLRISTRILFLVFLFLSLMIIGSGQSTSRLDELGRQLALIAEHHMPLLRCVGEILSLHRERDLVWREAIKDKNSSMNGGAGARDKIAGLSREIDVLFARSKALVGERLDDPKNAGLHAELDKIFDQILKAERHSVRYAARALASLALDGTADNANQEKAAEEENGFLTPRLDSLRDYLERFTIASAQSIRSKKELTEFFVALFSFVSVTGSIFMAFAVSYSVISPVRNAAEVAGRVTAGTSNVRFADSAPDEIGQLLRTMDHMLQALHKAQRELALANEGLENKVRERTRELEEKNRQLDRSNQALDDFAHVASHDLKEPLRGIANYADFLLEDHAGQLDAEGLGKLKTIKRLAERLKLFIDSLLYYSQYGRTDLAVMPTDLNEVLDEILDSLGVTIREKNATIVVPGKLPTVTCDRVRVGEIFRNLVVNAMKYSDKPQKRIEIGFNKSPGKPCEFYVSDDGIGIPDKHLSTIFGAFKRLHGRDDYGGGAGVGLAIVKKIVDLHGGRVWAESAPGRGATFRFTLEPETAAGFGLPAPSRAG